MNAVTTSTGTVAERYAYSAYGEPTICDASGSTIASSSINNRYTYTGREWDATVGLYYFRARFMSPKTGRFLGRDPIGFGGSMWNLYEYAKGTPQSLLDPTGLCGQGQDKADCHDNCGKTLALCLATTGIMCWRCVQTCAWFPPPWNGVCLAACALSCVTATGICLYGDYECNRRCEILFPLNPPPPPPTNPGDQIA
ncbi:RHS repeat domain-containing protein [Pirellulaceae bacterium SH467]